MTASLAVLVAQMEEALMALQQVMQAEHQQLSATEINGSALQRITEQKTSLLATLDYLEQQRQQRLTEEQDPQAMQRWQQFMTPLQQLSDLNQHNGWLLENQLARTRQVLAMLKPYQESGLYDAEGHSTTIKRTGGGKKIMV